MICYGYGKMIGCDYDLVILDLYVYKNMYHDGFCWKKKGYFVKNGIIEENGICEVECENVSGLIDWSLSSIDWQPFVLQKKMYF